MREVAVVVNEPWSFVGERGNKFTASVLATDDHVLLLLLAGQHYVATRRAGDSYGLIPTTEEQSREAPPWGRDLWRGQPIALLADIRDI